MLIDSAIAHQNVLEYNLCVVVSSCSDTIDAIAGCNALIHTNSILSAMFSARLLHSHTQQRWTNSHTHTLINCHFEIKFHHVHFYEISNVFG